MKETNIQDLEKLLNDIQKKGHNLKPIMNTIGEKIVAKSMEAFEKESDPITGRAWSPISSTSLFASTGGKKKSKIKSGKRYTKAFLRKLNDKRILQDQGVRGGLMGSIKHKSTKNSTTITVYKVYGATHQFGDESRNIKQRRFLPFDDNLDLDGKLKDEIKEDILDYILK